jgi:flavin-binding protein dodecin
MLMGVINTIDLEGVSNESWGEAAREALREAAKTIRHIQKMDVIDTACSVKDNKIIEFRTQVRLYFDVEPSR